MQTGGGDKRGDKRECRHPWSDDAIDSSVDAAVQSMSSRRQRAEKGGAAGGGATRIRQRGRGPAGSLCGGRRGGAHGEAATVPDGEFKGGREDGPHRTAYRPRPDAGNIASPPNEKDSYRARRQLRDGPDPTTRSRKNFFFF